MSKELAKTYDPKGLEDRIYQKSVFTQNGWTMDISMQK